MRVSLDLKLLYNLHFICESGSLSAAAGIPAVSQPTLLRAVSQLENRIGRQLMVRGRNGVKLTEARILLAEPHQIAIWHAAPRPEFTNEFNHAALAVNLI